MIKKVFSNNNPNTFFLAISIASLIFFYDIKFLQFDFRYLIILSPIYLLFTNNLFKNLNTNKIDIIIFLPIFFIIFLHSNLYSVNFSKSLISLFSLFFVFTLLVINKKYIGRSIEIAVILFLFIIVLAFFVYNFFEPLKSEFRKLHILIFELCRGVRLNGAKFIFSESSHFQIVFIPAFYYWMINCKKNNLHFIVLSGILLFLYISNITTSAIISGILISIYIFIIKFFFKEIIVKRVLILNVIILFSVLLILFFQKSDNQIKKCQLKLRDMASVKSKINPFSDEKTVSKKKSNKIIDKIYEKENKSVINITSFTYLTNIKLALDTLIKKPLGYGFNNYEVAYNKYVKEVLFVKKYYKPAIGLNRNDGGSTLIKMVVEFGYVSFLLLIPVIYFAFNKKISLNNRVFLSTLILTQLIRGVGYFNGGFILILLIIYLALLKRIKL